MSTAAESNNANLECGLKPVSNDEDRLKQLIIRRRKRNTPEAEDCPYQFANVFEGRLGPINYSLDGTEGPLVITFHGLNGTRMTFKDVANNLSKFQFRVLCFDLYGHGLSACPSFTVFGSNYSTDFFCDQTDDILAHLGFEQERFNLIGFSMGCVIAAAFAKRHAGQIDRMVLVSPAGLIRQKPLPVKLLRSCQCYVPCVPVCVCKCCFCQKQFLTNFTSEERASGHAKALWDRMMWTLFVKKGSLPAFLGCVSRVPLWNARDVFAEVGGTGLPVLILWGAQDTIVPLEVSDDVKTCFVNHHLIVFSHSAHVVLADAPAGSVASIVTFLQFPPSCRMEDFQYLLPFSPEGIYRRANRRRPPDMSMDSYLAYIGYTPTNWVKLANEKRVPTLPTPAFVAEGRTLKPERSVNFDQRG
eukprot:Blabericola_migrator_1__6829@NODE_345_length_9575_cov_29_104544_g278_i0_p4_GENE_NODE_345_length_9575_cov_29_104544_g278_i0NODE_345_length_9575_cov_29_104544_g278_i0_p4_ORF_typecomplete_len415_score49_83Abhydrolase_1/PF00561_20/1e31Hydrolase_4/PF12146_8/3_7e31Abhydrolase_6/PF12697_7/2_6e17DUF1057/PF06342_12/1_8e16DLH/PF01738_18/1_6e12Abhydrolase_2/PF02230_16/1e05Abhydrolase_2/PF02230_16/0_097Ndr/PF03096_14/2_9e08Chlorophyllase2/PF12740_7/4_8e08FSH1/PF03959_13/1_1e07DUF1100/PF06500_11/8_3e06Ser_hy